MSKRVENGCLQKVGLGGQEPDGVRESLLFIISLVVPFDAQ